jgi:hypothetical protein
VGRLFALVKENTAKLRSQTFESPTNPNMASSGACDIRWLRARATSSLRPRARKPCLATPGLQFTLKMNGIVL